MLRALSLLTLLLMASAVPTARAQSMESCSVMVSVDGKMRIQPTPGYSITGAPTPLQAPPDLANVSALVCDRATLTIGENDHRVLVDLDIPLYLRGDNGTIVLEMVNGQFRVRMMEGNLTEDEWAVIQQALNRAQSLYQDAEQ